VTAPPTHRPSTSVVLTASVPPALTFRVPVTFAPALTAFSYPAYSVLTFSVPPPRVSDPVALPVPVLPCPLPMKMVSTIASTVPALKSIVPDPLVVAVFWADWSEMVMVDTRLALAPRK